MSNDFRQYLVTAMLLAGVSVATPGSAKAQQRIRNGNGQQGGVVPGRLPFGGGNQGGMGPGIPPFGGRNQGGMIPQPGGVMPGGGGRRNNGGGGLLDQLINPAGANGERTSNIGRNSPYPNPGGQPNFVVDPATGQVIQVFPQNSSGPVQQPAVTQTRVYDQATYRIYILETNQYTGELWDPVNQRAYLPTETTAAAASPPATAQPAATKPVEPAKPAGPPKNTFIAKLKPPTEITRKQILRELRTKGYENFLADELEATLHPGLFSDVDRERLLELAERKQSVSRDKIEILKNAIDQLDSYGVSNKLDEMEVGRDQYPGVIERIALSKVYRELAEAGLQSSAKARQAALRLGAAATRAGLPRDVLRSVTQQLEAFSRIYEELDEPNVGTEGYDLAGVTPETIFTVVRWRGFASSIPALLAPETLLLPLAGKGTAANKLTIGTATAWELGLPICGSLNPPVPDRSEGLVSGAAGVTFRVDREAIAEATIYVTDENEKLAHPYTLRPGTSLPFPTRKSVQMSFSDGRGGLGPWETVSAGAYILSTRGGVWQKASEIAQITIDNSANGYPFHYRMGGQAGTVPARQVVPLRLPSSVTPIEFDRGVGDAFATKFFPGKDARYVVRAASAGGLDLFEPDSQISNEATTLADAGQPVRTPASLSNRATARSAAAPTGALETIRPRFPVGTLDD